MPIDPADLAFVQSPLDVGSGASFRAISPPFVMV